MKIPDWLDLPAQRARRRVSKLSEEQMTAWADVAGSEMRQCLHGYLDSREPQLLDEFLRALVSLVAVGEELRSRSR